MVIKCNKVILSILALSLTFTSKDLAAQQKVVLKGHISDQQSGKSLVGANVRIKGTQIGASSNADGIFEITQLARGEYFIIVSFIGYNPIQQSVSLNDQVTFIELKLTPTSTELSGVTVIGQSEEQAEVQKVKQNVMPVTVITSKQIENRAGNLNEILARQAGVQLRQSGGVGSSSKINVRGLEGKRVQVFIDGNPLNTPDGSLGINDLPVQIIERIEIYKGSVPAHLGGDGLGSAVNVVMKHRDVSYMEASITRQSYNTQILSLILKKTFVKQGIEVGAGVFDTRSDNDYIMQSPFQPELKIKRDHDQFHSLLSGGSIRFHKLWFDEVEIEAGYIPSERQIQGIYQNIQHVNSSVKTFAQILNLSRENFANNKLGLKYSFIAAQFNSKLVDTSAYNYNWDGTRIPSRLGKGELGIGPNLSTNKQKDFRQRINLDYRITPNFTLNLNSNSRYANVDPDDSLGNAFAGKNIYNYKGTVRNNVVGLTLESRFNDDKLLFSAALKHYHNKVDGYNTSIYNATNGSPDKLRNITNVIGYNAGLRYNFSKLFLVKASYERGVRLPNNQELFGDGILITPTTSLNPEYAHNFNTGLVYDKPITSERRLQIEGNGFYMNVDNLIQLSGNGLSLGYVNYAKANITGLDFEVKYDLLNNLFASFNATYQILTDINKLIPGTSAPNPTYKLQIPNTPNLFFNWNMEFHKTDLLGKDSKTRLIYDGAFVNQYSFGFNISVYDDFVIPSYLIHTLSVEQSFKDSRYIVSAEVNNLTDQVVINNFNQPLAGRTFRLKLRYLLLGTDNVHQD
jgi:vitamin B12 transporter